MTKITELHISSDEDLVEFSNKLVTLLQALDFTEMSRINIATRLLDLMHHIFKVEPNFKITIALEKAGEDFELYVSVYASFDEKNLNNYVKALTSLHFYVHHLNDQEFQIVIPVENNGSLNDPGFIQELHEKIIIQSKSELMRQVTHKNEELNKLLQDLKNSSSLIQSEKMRALGTLTAGVAHELNNPMMGILNFIQYCIKKTDPEDKRYEALKDAEHETKRCMEIVTNLLTFSHLEKEGAEEFKQTDVVSLIRRVEKILTYRLRNEQVTLKEEIPEKVPTIMAAENRLQQVFLNLITNAIDAMKKSTEKVLTLKVDVKENNLKFTIADTGEGMDEETKNKIFEPFFTTKPTGSGTGLGLSVCESIIKEHAGNIICYTEKNKGTQFNITLPMEVKENIEEPI